MKLVRYVKGPDALSFGDVLFKRGQWQKVKNAVAYEAMLPERVEEYAFEIDEGDDGGDE